MYTASDLLKGPRVAQGVSLPQAMIVAIKNISAEEDSSFSGYVQQALIAYITKDGNDDDDSSPHDAA